MKLSRFNERRKKRDSGRTTVGVRYEDDRGIHAGSLRTRNDAAPLKPLRGSWSFEGS